MAYKREYKCTSRHGVSLLLAFMFNEVFLVLSVPVRERERENISLFSLTASWIACLTLSTGRLWEDLLVRLTIDRFSKLHKKPDRNVEYPLHKVEEKKRNRFVKQFRSALHIYSCRPLPAAVAITTTTTTSSNRPLEYLHTRWLLDYLYNKQRTHSRKWICS